jgi:hypothetical protein
MGFLTAQTMHMEIKSRANLGTLGRIGPRL